MREERKILVLGTVIRYILGGIVAVIRGSLSSTAKWRIWVRWCPKSFPKSSGIRRTYSTHCPVGVILRVSKRENM